MCANINTMTATKVLAEEHQLFTRCYPEDIDEICSVLIEAILKEVEVTKLPEHLHQEVGLFDRFIDLRNFPETLENVYEAKGDDLENDFSEIRVLEAISSEELKTNSSNQYLSQSSEDHSYSLPDPQETLQQSFSPKDKCLDLKDDSVETLKSLDYVTYCDEKVKSIHLDHFAYRKKLNSIEAGIDRLIANNREENKYIESLEANVRRLYQLVGEIQSEIHQEEQIKKFIQYKIGVVDEKIRVCQEALLKNQSLICSHLPSD